MKDKLNLWDKRDIGGTNIIPISSLALNFLLMHPMWLLKIFPIFQDIKYINEPLETKSRNIIGYEFETNELNKLSEKAKKLIGDEEYKNRENPIITEFLNKYFFY